MSCCNHRCNQGRDCIARRRLVNITRAMVGYVAGDWLDQIEDPGLVKLLEAKIDERLAQIRGEA